MKFSYSILLIKTIIFLISESFRFRNSKPNFSLFKASRSLVKFLIETKFTIKNVLTHTTKHFHLFTFFVIRFNHFENKFSQSCV